MILAVLQARVSSVRLPGKVLMPLLGKPMISRQIDRVKRSERIDRLVVATSMEERDNKLSDLCREKEVPCFRGSLEDVLDRFYQATLSYNPEHVVRLTGDCPVIDPHIIDEVIDFYFEGEFDYATNSIEPYTFPDGLDVEIFKFGVLERAWKEAVMPSHREHVSLFIRKNPQFFKLGRYENSTDLSHLRFTVDEAEDFEYITKIYEELFPENPLFTTADILDLIRRKPSLSEINSDIQRNEGGKKSQAADVQYLMNETIPEKRYKTSRDTLARALKTIPLGSQTFSKSKTAYPYGISPHFIVKGSGSHVWDIDNNEYIDFVNALAAITLGYNDPDVTCAVKSQLDDGTIFSLPHELEIRVAEKITEMVPCAEMVRFGKNGSDATAGAVRLARAFTGRDHVAVCGYHGWQDWYIGSTSRDLGVPKEVSALTHTFQYNNIESLYNLFHSFPGDIACVIMEPMNSTEPENCFLEEIRDLTEKNGCLLIFDEMVTGFRFARGGAQEYFGVIPDIAAFGKGLSNGYPVSAIAGRADVMKLMEEIFFSFTFAGETLSLAAAEAALTRIQKEDVIESFWIQGGKIVDGIQRLIKKYALEDAVSLYGKQCWPIMKFKDSVHFSQWEIKTLFLQEVFKRGILVLGSHNMSYAHTDSDIERLLIVYDEVFSIIKDGLINRGINKMLQVEPLIPLFSVR